MPTNLKILPQKRDLTFWRNIATLCLVLIMVVMLLKTFSDSPTISGYAVFDSPEDASSRFLGTLSVLLVIFAAFGLVLFIYSKKVETTKK